MTRQEAFQVLGVKPGSNKYEIEHRYTLLTKSFRGKSDPDTLERIEQVTIAYDVLTGRYVPPPPVDPRQEKVIFGKKRKEWANIWNYGKAPLAVGLVIVGLVSWLIYSIATNTQPDFMVSAFGDFQDTTNFMTDEPTGLEKVIREQNPEILDPIITLNLLSERAGVDPQLIMGSQMKQMLMMSGAEKVDILILDGLQYQRLVPEGILVPLDDIYQELLAAAPEAVAEFIRPLEGTLSPEALPEGEIPVKHIYGFDLSEKQVLNSLDISGSSQIWTICYHSERKERAEEVTLNLLKTITEWYDAERGLITEPIPTTQP